MRTKASDIFVVKCIIFEVLERGKAAAGSTGVVTEMITAVEKSNC